MNYHRGLLFWGLALITGGAVALAAQQGYIDRAWLDRGVAAVAPDPGRHRPVDPAEAHAGGDRRDHRRGAGRRAPPAGR